MGYMRNHIKEAHEIALSLFDKDMITEITPPVTNLLQSFMIAPDGSKEGWDKSDKNDKLRAEFIHALKNTDNWCKWAEVQYGDDERHTYIVNHSDE